MGIFFYILLVLWLLVVGPLEVLSCSFCRWLPPFSCNSEFLLRKNEFKFFTLKASKEENGNKVTSGNLSTDQPTLWKSWRTFCEASECIIWLKLVEQRWCLWKLVIWFCFFFLPFGRKTKSSSFHSDCTKLIMVF